jgi:putative ABC transport system permease protein
MIVNGILSSTVGVELGETVELTTPAGTETYTIVAIATDYLSAKIPTATISHANLAADFNQTEDMLYLVDVADANRETSEEALKVVLSQYPQFSLVDGQAYVEQNLQLFQTAFAGLGAMVVFLAIPSLIAMVNTLAIGVIERTREIGTLRALGATRGQVRTVIVAEAVILAGIGTALGLLSGLYLGYMAVEGIRSAGFPLEYSFPSYGLVLAVVAGIAFGIIAAIIPARQATKLQIVDALRWD